MNNKVNLKKEELQPVAELLTEVREDQIIIDKKCFYDNGLVLHIRDQESDNLLRVSFDQGSVSDVVDDFEPELEGREYEWLQREATPTEKQRVFRQMLNVVIGRSKKLIKNLQYA